MDLVRRMTTRMGFSPDDVEILVDMVRHHLLLPDTATRRDLDDPTTVSNVARAAGDPVTLHLLGALTEADSRATGPSAWGSWKAGLVAELVTRADRVLAGEPRPAGPAPLPPEYQVLIDEVQATGLPSVSLDPPRVVVAAPDRSGLLSAVAGALALHGMDVRAANVSGEGGVAVEVFTVEVARGTWPDTARLREDLADVLSDPTALATRLSERGRVYPAPRRSAAHVPGADVRVDNDASETCHRAGGAGSRRGRSPPPHHPRPVRSAARCRLGPRLHARRARGGRVLRAGGQRGEGDGSRSPRPRSSPRSGLPCLLEAPKPLVASPSYGPGTARAQVVTRGCTPLGDRGGDRGPGRRRRRIRPDPPSPHPRRGHHLDATARRCACWSTAPTGANVDSGSVISVQFSTDLAPGSPMPTLSPPVAGQWAALSPKLLQYQATAPLVPGAPGDHHGSRRRARRRGLARPAPARTVHQFLHRCPGLHAPTAADVGRAGLPPPQLHRGVAPDIAHPGRRPPDRHVHLALGQPARLLDVVVDAGYLQRDHQGRRDELRVAAQPQDGRDSRPRGVGRHPDRGRGRAGQCPPLRVRLRQPEPARERHRLPERRCRLYRPWPTPEWPAHQPAWGPSPSMPATR